MAPKRRPFGQTNYREDLERAEVQALQDYSNACQGVRVLCTLDRKGKTLVEQIRFFEAKLDVLPRLLAGYRNLLNLRSLYAIGRISKRQFQNAIPGLVHAFPELEQFPFPAGYVPGTLDEERAIVQCQLSEARWRVVVESRTGTAPRSALCP